MINRHLATSMVNQIPENVDTIFAVLDDWVVRHGKDGYVAEDFTPIDNHGLDHGIQQVRAELYQFVSVILSRDLCNTILEIGLGTYGGTHCLWRHIFKRVVTIEISGELIDRFKQNELLDSRDIFIKGASQDPNTLHQVIDLVPSADVLFIDGDHAYKAVFGDWLMYHNFVKPGGIVAFHDAVTTQPHFGVKNLLEEFAAGKIDGKPHVLHPIVQSREVGMSYEDVTASSPQNDALATANFLLVAEPDVEIPTTSSQTEPVLIRDGYRGFNVVLFKGQYFAIARTEGAFDHSRFQAGGYARCFAANTVAEAYQAIDVSVRHHQPDTGSKDGIGLVRTSLKKATDRFQIFRNELLRIMPAIVKSRSKSPVYDNRSINVDLSQTEPVLIRDGYRGFNIVLFKGQYFAIARTEGAFDHSRFQAGGYARCFAANTVAEAYRAIDESVRHHQPG